MSYVDVKEGQVDKRRKKVYFLFNFREIEKKAYYGALPNIILDEINQYYGDYEDNYDRQICLLLTRGDIVINNDTIF